MVGMVTNAIRKLPGLEKNIQFGSNIHFLGSKHLFFKLAQRRELGHNGASQQTTSRDQKMRFNAQEKGV